MEDRRLRSEMRENGVYKIRRPDSIAVVRTEIVSDEVSSQVAANAAWLTELSKEACRLAVKIGFNAATQAELSTIRDIAESYIETGAVDREVGEACLERLREAANAMRDLGKTLDRQGHPRSRAGRRTHPVG